MRTPLGSVVVVIVIFCDVLAATVMDSALLAVALFASFTCTVNENVPDAVGVPEITPVEEFRDNPAGRDTPLTPHV